MELGFHSDFFSQLLRRTGWLGMEGEHPHFWKARRRSDPIVVDASDPRVRSNAGVRKDGVLHIAVPGGSDVRSYAVFGPGITLPPGRYRGELVFRTPGPMHLAAVDACCDQGKTILSSAPGTTSLVFEITKPACAVEFRLLARGGFSAIMEHMTFQAIN
jgi:hypothetical protein